MRKQQKPERKELGGEAEKHMGMNKFKLIHCFFQATPHLICWLRERHGQTKERGRELESPVCRLGLSLAARHHGSHRRQTGLWSGQGSRSQASDWIGPGLTTAARALREHKFSLSNIVCFITLLNWNTQVQNRQNNSKPQKVKGHLSAEGSTTFRNGKKEYWLEKVMWRVVGRHQWYNGNLIC